MPLRHVLTALFLLLVLLPGCSFVVKAPQVTLREAGIVGLNGSGIEIEFFLNISNPNSFDLSLLGYSYHLDVMYLPLSTGEKQQTLLFPAGKETVMRLPLRLKFADLLEIINRAPDPDNLPYQFNSILQIKTPLGRMSMPLEKNSTLAIPKEYRSSGFINRLRDALRGLH